MGRPEAVAACGTNRMEESSVTALQKLGVAFAIVAGGIEIAVATVESPIHPVAVLVEITAAAGTAALLAAVAAVDYARQAAIVAANPKPTPVSNRTPLAERLAREEWNAAYAAGFAYAEQLAIEAEQARRKVTVTTTLEMPVAVTHEMPRVDDGIPEHWRPVMFEPKAEAPSAWAEVADVPQPLGFIAEQDALRESRVTVVHLQGAAERLASPAAWDGWRWESAA